MNQMESADNKQQLDDGGGRRKGSFKKLKRFVLALTLLNLVVFIAYVSVSFYLIDQTVCEHKLFVNNNYRVRDRQNQLLLHDLASKSAIIYEPQATSNDQKVALRRTLGVRLINSDFWEISLTKGNCK